MSDQDAGDEASRDQIAALEDFEAKFKPQDFAGVAQALRLSEEPETLSCLRETPAAGVPALGRELLRGEGCVRKAD